MEQADAIQLLRMSSLGFMANNGFLCVTLSSSITPETATAESSTEAVINTFKDGRDLLADWHCITARMYLKRQDMIPDSSQLSFRTLYDSGSIMTHIYNKATKQRGLIAAAIKSSAIEMGVNELDVKLFELDCFSHLHSIWFGRATDECSKTLQEVLQDHLNELLTNLCIHTDIVTLLHAVEKECAKTANYAKDTAITCIAS